MRLHERTMPTQAACVELSSYVLGWVQRHGLTYGEALKGLNEAQASLVKMLIREERHPDEEGKRGDEE